MRELKKDVLRTQDVETENVEMRNEVEKQEGIQMNQDQIHVICSTFGPTSMGFPNCSKIRGYFMDA